MDIIYLDQNHWIELAKVESGKITSGWLPELYQELSTAVANGQLICPLSPTHLLETSKRNDPVSRSFVARTQAALSLGRAYRSYESRLQVELQHFLRPLFQLQPLELPDQWFIGQSFLQCFAHFDVLTAERQEASRELRIEKAFDAKFLYLDFMLNQDDRSRRAAHQFFEKALHELVQRREHQRCLCSHSPLDLRLRAYRAQQFLGVQDTIIQVMHQLGLRHEQFMRLGAPAVIGLMEKTPTLNVEAEFSARLEIREKSLNTHDGLDVQAIYTGIPYSTYVIAEKSAIALARQAKFDQKYKVKLSSSLEILLGVYRQQAQASASAASSSTMLPTVAP